MFCIIFCWLCGVLLNVPFGGVLFCLYSVGVVVFCFMFS